MCRLPGYFQSLSGVFNNLHSCKEVVLVDVLKCRFCYFSDRIRKLLPWKRRFATSEGRVVPRHEGPLGEDQGGPGLSQGLYCGFCEEGKASRPSRWRVGQFEWFQWTLRPGLCLWPDQRKGCFLLECKRHSWHRRAFGVWGQELLVCHERRAHREGLLCLGTPCPWEEPSSPGQPCPQKSMHGRYRKKEKREAQIFTCQPISRAWSVISSFAFL